MKRSTRTPSGEPKRQPVSTKITPDLRARLEAAAAAEGRTLGAEIERRLMASFEPREDLRAIVREEMRAALDGMIIEKLHKRAP